MCVIMHALLSSEGLGWTGEFFSCLLLMTFWHEGVEELLWHSSVIVCPGVCPHLHTSPCLTSPVCLRVRWEKNLSQLFLISLVVHNSGSLSLCPVNEDADVIELPPPPLVPSLFPLPLLCVLSTVGTFPPLSQGSMLLLHFLWSCITVQQSCCVASPISSSPGGMVTVGNSGPENWPSFQYSRKTFPAVCGARLPKGERH